MNLATTDTLDDILLAGQHLIEETNLILSLCGMDDWVESNKALPTRYHVVMSPKHRCISPSLAMGTGTVTGPFVGERCGSTVSIESCTTTRNLECHSQRSHTEEIIWRLGSTPPSRATFFVDVSTMDHKGIASLSRGGYKIFFPELLHNMLTGTALEGKEDIVSFLPHGRAFAVHDMNRFVNDILPRYFRGQRAWTSFARQLSLYGFLRVQDGMDEGAYYHPLFLRGYHNLSRYMRRVGTPKAGPDRRKDGGPRGAIQTFTPCDPCSQLRREYQISNCLHFIQRFDNPG